MNNLKKTLALMGALVMSATAFVGCGDKNETSTSSKAESSAAESSADESSADESSEEESSTIDPSTKSTEVGEVKLATGGDKFTVAAWNADDVPYLIAQYKGTECTDDYKEDLKNGKVEGINFINFGVGGGDASKEYDNLFKSGKDVDVYFCEADWALKYINDDSLTAPLSDLGFTDANFAEIYSYTDEIGKDKNGVRKGVSWQAAAGGFAYRADLAEEYLGVKNPEEMQAKISSWDDFVEAAKTISDKSSGKTALADTLGGMWQAYACGRKQPWVVDNKLVIDEFCKEFADTAKTLWDCGGVTKNTQWSDDWKAAGQNDSCMGYFASTWGYGGFILEAAGGAPDEETNKPAGKTYGKWAVCQGPVSYYWGGTWIVVHPKTDNAQEAQDFIKMATVDNDQMKKYSTSKPEFVNNTVVMDELIKANTVFNEKITGNMVDNQNIYAPLYENAKNIDFKGLITEYDATCKTNFIDAVQKNYLAGKSWEDTEEAFKDLVADALPSLDWE